MVEPLERSVFFYMHRQFVLLNENLSVASAVKLMQQKKVETIIVTRNEFPNEFPVGIVTDSDILEKVVIKGEDSDLVLLRSIMTSPIITLASNSTVKEAIESMRLHRIKKIPIIDSSDKTGKKIVGMVLQKTLADSIRNSVIEKTFRSYRVTIREHYKPIFGNVGFVMQFAGILMIVPSLLATFMNELHSATGIYLTVVTTFFVGFVLNIFGEKSPLNLKQASIVVVLSFVLLSLFGSLPYIYVNPFWNNIDYVSLFVNSFLESTSGFTTTGISTIVHPEDLPASFVFYRSYTLWVGGLSFIYLVMALYYPETKLAAMKNMIGGGILKFRQLLSTITIIFVVYAAIFTILLYTFGSEDIIDSVSVVFATLTSGGFVPISTFLDSENTLQLTIIMIGMIVSALPFAFHYGIFSREFKTKKLWNEIIIYCIFMSIFIVILIIIESSVSDVGWLSFVFHAISASTTTGFQFLNLVELSDGGKILLIILMLVGGTAFSTAGGIKISRFLYIFKKLGQKMNLLSYSDTDRENISASISSTSQFRKGIEKYNINKSDQSSRQKLSLLSDKAFKEALMVISLFIIFSIGSGISLTFLTNNSFIDSLFESVSTISNTGLSVGITAMDLDLLSKIILSSNMIIGRFEIIAIFYIFIFRLRI